MRLWSGLGLRPNEAGGFFQGCKLLGSSLEVYYSFFVLLKRNLKGI